MIYIPSVINAINASAVSNISNVSLGSETYGTGDIKHNHEVDGRIIYLYFFLLYFSCRAWETSLNFIIHATKLVYWKSPFNFSTLWYLLHSYVLGKHWRKLKSKISPFSLILPRTFGWEPFSQQQFCSKIYSHLTI